MEVIIYIDHLDLEGEVHSIYNLCISSLQELKNHYIR
jgi:hypothetical protein